MTLVVSSIHFISVTSFSGLPFFIVSVRTSMLYHVLTQANITEQVIYTIGLIITFTFQPSSMNITPLRDEAIDDGNV